MRWARRQQWLSVQEDRDWTRQTMQPPILDSGRLYVTQPGVKAVECVDAESGKLVWRKVLPTICSIVGLLDDQVIVQTNEGLQAISTQDGQSLWYHDADQMMEASLVGQPGGIMYARTDRKKDSKQAVPTLVWLDPKTGQPTKQTSLNPLKHERPRLGPWITMPDRLWVFAGAGLEEGARTLYDVTAVGPANAIEP